MMGIGDVLLTVAFLVVYMVGVWTILTWAWKYVRVWQEAWFLRRYGVPQDEIEQWEDEHYGYDGR